MSIPRIIHRVIPAQTPLSEEIEGWWRGWEELHPGWEFHTWPDQPNMAEFPRTSPHMESCAGVQRADLIRLEALLIHGGIYLDDDVAPVRRLDPLLALRGFSAWESPSIVCTAALGAEPGHPAIEEAMALCIERVDQGAGPWETGPGVATQVYPNRTDWICLPPGTFYPYYIDQRERRDEDFSLLPWCFGVHHWAGSWL
ncbi:MAG: glycosyltransferase [Candidatus Dormibacteria bacterium]|jgi:mannosyltransferase OCH1-like enzyme